MALAVAAPVTPAHAIASVGLSHDCDSYGHCVTGTAASSNGSVTVELFDLGLGSAVAVCKGGANGSMLLDVTCSIGSDSRRISFPGTTGAVPIVTDTSTLSRLPVCWDVVGYFPNLAGSTFAVPTDGCALLAV